MADTAISAVLFKLGELAVSEAKILFQVGDDIILLRDRLEWLQAFVRDADRRRRAGTVDGLTLVSVRQTRDVAFEAEDALDDFFHEDEEVAVQDSGRRWKKLYRCFTGFGTKLVVRHGLSDRIKMIKSRLDQISVNQKEYNIVHTPSVVLASSTTAIAAWRDDLENAEGFDDDAMALVEMLNREDQNRPMFISIVGESGSGKNTLARIICRILALDEHDKPIVIWYTMEPGSSINDVLTEVHRRASLTSQGQPEVGGSSSADIGDKLRHLLAGRRYLLILDGISSKTTLNCLKGSLPHDDGRGRCQVMLILDTENEQLGWDTSTMNRDGTSIVHTLERLDRERSGQLFFWKVFRKEQYSSSSHGKESSYRRKEYEKKLAALKQKREEEEKQAASLTQKREEEEKQTEQQDEEEQAALKKEKSDAAMEFHAKMKERQEKGKSEDELAALRKKRIENEKKEEEKEAALKKKREEKKKEEQAAIKRKREEIKEQEQELAALKQKIEQEAAALKQKKEEEAADRELHERLVHEITGGYPMALVLLAGLLRFKEKPGQWNAVLEQLKPGNNGSAQDGGGEGLPNGQITSNQQGCRGARRAIENVFWASFEDLPNDLRSCLLYFAGYPSNFSHSADTIVRMWIAEGFIRRQKGKTLEEVGYDYLKELVLRCLVEVKEMKVDGGIQFVKIHRSLMGFLKAEVLESGFMEIHDIHEALVPSTTRRLFVQSDNGTRYAATFASNKEFPKLRSFICHIINDQDHLHHDLNFLLWSRFLRVLSVQGLSLTELPDQIGDMIQLRYLKIDCWSLLHLPSSIVKLLSLQTLDITNTQVKEIHQDFWNIKTLRHVLASDLTLPKTMTVVGERQGGGELQTLHGVKPVGTEDWSVANSPLVKMTNLQSLEMHGFILEKHGEAVLAALCIMPLLGHLKLQGDKIPVCVFTNPILQSLQTMVLHGYVNWMDSDLIRRQNPIRKVRPNLVQLTLNHKVPPSIKEELLEGIKVVEEES